LVEMCIFACPTTFVTSVFFSFHIKNVFSIFHVVGGVKTGVFCVKWPPRAMCKTSPL
jgi:hypothetical protein